MTVFNSPRARAPAHGLAALMCWFAVLAWGVLLMPVVLSSSTAVPQRGGQLGSETSLISPTTSGAVDPVAATAIPIPPAANVAKSPNASSTGSVAQGAASALQIAASASVLHGVIPKTAASTPQNPSSVAATIAPAQLEFELFKLNRAEVREDEKRRRDEAEREREKKEAAEVAATRSNHLGMAFILLPIALSLIYVGLRHFATMQLWRRVGALHAQLRISAIVDTHFSLNVDGWGRCASSKLNVYQSSTISLKRPVAGLQMCSA